MVIRKKQSKKIVKQESSLPKKDLSRLRTLLLQRRKELFNRIRELHSGKVELTERQIEYEEEAQEAEISEPYEMLDKQAEAEILEIDHALSKMGAGSYGMCEHCGTVIPLERLFAIPWTRVCLSDAEAHKREQGAPPLRKERSTLELPSEYRVLTDEQLADAVREQIQNDGRVDSEELSIRVRDGVVIMEGNLPNKHEQQIVHEIISDVMGLNTIDDRLHISELLWKEEDLTIRPKKLH